MNVDVCTLRLMDEYKQWKEENKNFKVEKRDDLFLTFIDLKGAYDRTSREKTYQILTEKNILNKEEIDMLKFQHNNLRIKLGNNSTTTERGLVQGSIISPHLFNIFFEEALRRLKRVKGIKIYAFADDLLFTCRSKRKIKKGLQVLEEWCNENNMVINKNKSGIMRVIAPNTPMKKVTKMPKEIKGIKIVQNYKYLGQELGERLEWKSSKGKKNDAQSDESKGIKSIKDTFNALYKKFNWSAINLSKTTQHTTIKFNMNMVRTFVNPLIRQMAPLYTQLLNTKDEMKKECRDYIRTQYRKAVKKIVGINRNVETKLILKIIDDPIKIIEDGYKLARYKLNKRFNDSDEDFPVKLPKINHKLFPIELGRLLKLMGIFENIDGKSETITSAQNIGLIIEDLNFMGKMDKVKLAKNTRIVKDAIKKAYDLLKDKKENLPAYIRKVIDVPELYN